MTQFFTRLLTLLTTAALSACVAQPSVPVELSSARLEGWARGGDSTAVASPWLKQFESQELDTLVGAALADNYQLRQTRGLVREAVYDVTIAGAPLWPALSAAASGSRQRTAGDAVFSSQDVESYTLSSSLSWQLDIWGELRASQRASQLAFAAQLASYVDAEQTLAADVASRYFAAVEASELEELFVERLASLRESLSIIEDGYRSGLNEALDVYLAQNSVAIEEGNLAEQRQTAFETRAELELLLADYPAGSIKTPKKLPTLTSDVPVELPTNLLSRRPDLQVAWLDVLAANARLAVAHRQRFPSLTLTGSVSDNEASFNNNKLLDGGPLGLSIAASLVQPLFQGGQLLAVERRARERLEQTEAVYLDTVFAAFAEVENSISQTQSLREQLTASEKAARNAEIALELSFEQFRAGLVTYAIVLESQQRAFDAQTSEVRLAAAVLQNRIALNLALGGAFDDDGDQRISKLFDELSGWARSNKRPAKTGYSATYSADAVEIEAAGSGPAK